MKESILFCSVLLIGSVSGLRTEADGSTFGTPQADDITVLAIQFSG